MKKAQRSGRGCLTIALLILLIIVLGFFIYKWISGLGTARLVISSLELTQKTGRSGEKIEGTKLVLLGLTNTGNQSGSFALDLEDFGESKKLEGKRIGEQPGIWSFRSEVLFSGSEEWYKLANSAYWTGLKIVPGAIEVSIPAGTTLELESYLKTPRGWKIEIPEELIGEENSLLPAPRKLRISVISPAGEITASELIDL